MRKAYVNNKFYEGEKDALIKQIENCFINDMGPNEFPSKSERGNVDAIIVPHAGYFFSGPCACAGYKELAESRTDDVYLILAPNHSGRGFTSLTTEDYETPLGVAKINLELANLLVDYGLKNDSESHTYEHSVEVQLPFLQYITHNEMTFVPIVIMGEINSRKLTEIILNALSKFNKNVKIIVSSDFTHYGEHYGYTPFKKGEFLEKIEDMDRTAVQKIIDLDIEGFDEFLEDTKDTICGALPIIILLRILKSLGNYEGDLLNHYTSSHIMQDGDNSVSYSAIAFSKKND